MQLITIKNWPRAIAHVDADAFFASVEQSLDPKLKGRPVATGAERGIISAASYEAKNLGVSRGISIAEARRICPDCVFLPSDYETYSIYSKRMFAIMRRFTPSVEEYSIDEAFLDFTGLRRLHRTNYEGIARLIQDSICRELGITASIGISLSKSLAKLCSKLKKPAGLVAFGGRQIHELLAITPLKKVWGFGPNTVALLEKHGLRSALDFVEKPQSFASALIGKVGREIWMELCGEYVNEVNTAEPTPQSSISKAKTFTPASKVGQIVWAQALRNLESACIKARRHGLVAKKVCLSLRREDFESASSEMRMECASSSPTEIQPYLKVLFNELFSPSRRYRATNVVLCELSDASVRQLDLFHSAAKIGAHERLFEAVDETAKKYGKHAVFLADSKRAQVQHSGARGEKSSRKSRRMKGETDRKYIGLPVLKKP